LTIDLQHAAAVQMTDADRASVAQTFRKLLGDNVCSEVAFGSLRLASKIQRSTTTALFDAVVSKLGEGISSLLNGKTVDPMEFEGLAYFFMYYFNRVYAAADHQVQHDLRSKLSSSYEQESGLYPTFLELAVCHSFLGRGHKVDFKATVDGAASYEFDVHTKNSSMAVECKCVSTRRSAPYFKNAAEILGLLLDRALKLSDGFGLVATYSGRTDCSAEDGFTSFKAALTLWDENQSNDSGDDWLISAERLYTNRELVFDRPTTMVAYGHGAIAGIRSVHEWRLDRQIEAAVMKAVKKQLPKSGNTLVWVQLFGIAMTPKMEAGSGKWIEVAHKSVRMSTELRARFAQKDGFFGVVLMGDYRLEKLQNGSIQLNYDAEGSLSDHIPDALAFTRDFMKIGA
jgi:hypothetical protein